MVNCVNLNCLILILICAGYSVQKASGHDNVPKKSPRDPKPLQFLGLFGVYNDKDDPHASQSNKAFGNPGSLKNTTGVEQRKETAARVNHPKSGRGEHRNQRVRGRKPYIRKPPVLRINPTFLIDQIKQIFFDALQPYDASKYKATKTGSNDKSINPNPNKPTHEDNKTFDEIEFSKNDSNRTYRNKNQGPEKHQQFSNFNDTFRKSEVSTDKTVNSDPLDRIFPTPNNETLSALDKILEAPNVHSNETDKNETPDSPAADLIIKPAFDFSEEFQQPGRIEGDSSSSDKSFNEQTDQPTFENYRKYQEPYKSENGKITSEQFEQLIERTTNQPTMQFNDEAKKTEFPANKISNSEKLDDFIASMINQTIPDVEKMLQDQEISENRSANNIFKKSIDSDTRSQLFESDSSEPNSEFNTYATITNEHSFPNLGENNQPYSNFSKMFRNPKTITNTTHREEKPGPSNLYQSQPTTNFEEDFDVFDLKNILKNPMDEKIQKNYTSSTISKVYIDQNSFHHTNEPKHFQETFHDTELSTDETVYTNQFGQFNLDAKDTKNDSSKIFRNSDVTTKITVNDNSLHQFTVPQTNQFFFDFNKVFREPQASTTLEANNNQFETSFMPNLVETTFESEGEFQTSGKTDTNDSFEKSTSPENIHLTTEFLETYQESDESSMKTAKTFIYEDRYKITTKLDKNFQDSFISKTVTFSGYMLENSITPETIHTEMGFTETSQELRFHSKDFTTFDTPDLSTDQSPSVASKIYRNPHVPEVTENYTELNGTITEASQRFFEHDKLTAESVYPTMDTTGRETINTTIISASDQLTGNTSIHQDFTESDPNDFNINLGGTTSDTDFKEQKHLKDKTASNYPFIQHFMYPLCSKDSDLKKLAPCDNEYKVFMCNEPSSGTIKECDRSKPQNQIPICFLDFPHGRFLVSCSASPTKMCLYESGVETAAVRLCREPETALCIDERNKLKFCLSSTRVRRQVAPPVVPQLDNNAYYAKCEKCNLHMSMDIDEEDQKLVLKIRSETHDLDKD